MTRPHDGEPPVFDAAFLRKLDDLFVWRRDVRRFRPGAVEMPLIEELLRLAAHSPSVGYSQPWRFVSVESAERRRAVIASFNACNAAALADFDGARAALYAKLKLEGLREAPVHLAVFCDHATQAGFGVGQKTMPETLDYSVVAAIHAFWLAARAHGLGVGWVSIIDPLEVARAIDAPDGWKLIAYLCVGFPEEEHSDPELERCGWQPREPQAAALYRR
jgi:5,6-dimethylbenzimidazole synthase